MGIWNKSPRTDPSVIARLQAQLDADPMMQRFKAGYGSEGDPWRRGRGGRVDDPLQAVRYARSVLGSALPDGYDVSQDGEIVYTNKTPFLKQAVLSSLPITVPFGLQALGVGGGAGAAAGYGGPSAAAEVAGLSSKIGSMGAGGWGLGAGGVGGAAGGAAASGVLGGAGKSLLGRILTGIKDYAPLGLAGLSTYKGLTQNRPPAEHQLEGVINTAQGRINQAQPLWDDLVAMGGEDAALARSRRGAVDPLFQALSAMANAQMPDAYRRG